MPSIMPLRSKVTQIGGALYNAGSAAITTYKEQKQQHQQGTQLSSSNNNSGDHANLLHEVETSNEYGRKQQPELFEILSSLIEGVYAADRGKPNASLFWEALGYENEALQDEAATDEEIAAVGNPACKIRLMVFRRRDLDGAVTTELPKYVIAIRGTRKFCQRDILADLQILCETLHHNPLYDIVKTVTRRVVEKHSHEKVCVAGHSLGAAIGLLVTRELALEDMAVETHLFNPPFFSLETLMEKITSLGAKGIDKLNQAWVMKLVKAKKTKRDAEYLEAMAMEFTKLGKWAPSLYVNPYDSICNGYIDYFRNQNLFYGGRETLAVSLTAGSLRRFMALDSHSYHLIPAAHLWINHRGGNLFQSHPLVQWHQYPTVDLQHEMHDLLAADCTIAAFENLLQQPGEEWTQPTNSDSPLNCSVASKAATVERGVRRGVSSDETARSDARDGDEKSWTGMRNIPEQLGVQY